MLRPNLDELLLGDHDDEVPESLPGKPSVLPSTASIWGFWGFGARLVTSFP